jgi:hypothetical protein
MTYEFLVVIINDLSQLATPLVGRLKPKTPVCFAASNGVVVVLEQCDALVVFFIRFTPVVVVGSDPDAGNKPDEQSRPVTS